MEKMRKPFQGVWNIIRFNRHFYILSLIAFIFIFLLIYYLASAFEFWADILIIILFTPVFISLLISYYIYDLSDLYKLSWLDRIQSINTGKHLTIHAGFDEVSILLKHKFTGSDLMAFDFYQPEKHTEISIKRARKAYPAYFDTRKMTTSDLPLGDNSIDNIFVILSAHEIRSPQERIIFFRELERVVRPSGSIIVTEHLRDTVNFLAYNLGFFHFYSKKAWLRSFDAANLKVREEIKITPFITAFILNRNGFTT